MKQDLKTMSEAVEVLRQFKGFSYFSGMGALSAGWKTISHQPVKRLSRSLISKRMIKNELLL